MGFRHAFIIFDCLKKGIMKKQLVILAAIIAVAVSCGSNEGFTEREKEIINGQEGPMYVTVINDPEDSVILRTPSLPLTKKMLESPEFKALAKKMLITVNDPSQDGVGIAAPQVGINRRLAWVMRYDKEGKPFELFPNLVIESRFGEITHGPEGCLSVPPKRGLVPRYSSVIISYTDPSTLKPARDTISGYTAIIFQHECDHLDATLYIDRADTVFISESWVAERDSFERAGAYLKPEVMKSTKNR